MRWSPKPCGSIDRACGHARRGVGGGMVPFSFAGEDLLIMGQGALFWPARKALLIADLHLEKASFFARFGQMLPPYDSNATLAAIEALVDETGARELWCLGDSFHDGEGPFRLDEQARRRLLTLTARLDWTWITGNHDPLTAAPGSRVLDEACFHGICVRHATLGSYQRHELPGNWHPKLRMRVRGQDLSRRCFVHAPRSEEHTSELQSLMRISYAALCFKTTQHGADNVGTPVKNRPLISSSQ